MLFLKGQQPLTARPGEYLDDVNFDTVRKELANKQQEEVTDQDLISYVLYLKYTNNI